MRHALGPTSPLLPSLLRLGGVLQGVISVPQLSPIVRSVDEIVEKLPVTLSLLISATDHCNECGADTWLLAGLQPDRMVDRVVTSVVAIALAIPSFWLALILAAIFAVQLGWLPVAGYVSFRESPVYGHIRSCCPQSLCQPMRLP